MTDAPGRGARRRELGARTRTRILDTAQNLFAARGIDAVSVNEICKSCEVNSAAVHYHFGSKEKLVRQILQRGIDTWGQRRAELVAELEAGPAPTIHDVVRAMVVPTLELVDQTWGLDYVRFLAAVSTHPDYGGLSLSIADAHTDRYVSLLATALPQLPRPVLLWRYTLCRVFLYHALSLEPGPLSNWLALHEVAVTKELRNDFIAYFVGALTAPYTPDTANW
jgi:AcrR family transcriptional regulator